MFTLFVYMVNHIFNISLVLSGIRSLEVEEGLETNKTPNTFLEFKENTEEKTQELLKLKTLSHEANTKMKRYTEDGTLCASPFQHNGQIFFDCTNTRSPDGQMKEKEWCYVDETAKGDKPWDYCRPIIDYDKIRD